MGRCEGAFDGICLDERGAWEDAGMVAERSVGWG